MPAYRHENWSQLVGAFVEVRVNNQCVRTGYVEDAMPDSSALWLAANELGSRTLIAKVEGYEVWVEPTELDGAIAYKHDLVSPTQTNFLNKGSGNHG